VPDDLPFVDEHSVEVAASLDRVWAALQSTVHHRLVTDRGSWFTRLLGASPASGFGVAERVPGERIVLTGRHRFSRYRLVFSLVATSPATTRLSATTYAAFPGPQGAAYRFVVIGLGPHVLATRRMLTSVAARAEATA
jgi:hypothetical protein